MINNICLLLDVLKKKIYTVSEWERERKKEKERVNCWYLLQWDAKNGEIVQEYDHYLGAVNSVTFVDKNCYFVSTSDDKSLQVWEMQVNK